MNNPELDSILKKARLPEIPEESLAMFPRRIVAGIKRNDPPARAARSFSPHLAWAFGLAACVVIAFAIGLWRGRMEGETFPTTDSLASIKLIHETLAMFPNQVRAIVEDEHGLNLILSDTADVPVSTPIYVRICDGKQCSSLVTFSGQEIQIAGQKLTVLSDARGGIILTGNQFVWSNTGQIAAQNNLKISAKHFNSVSM
jgi:hypothetical protein